MLAGTLRPGDSVTRVKSVLESGGEVTFSPGTYRFTEGIVATIKDDLNVNAEGAKFVADGVDGDLFRLNGRGKGKNRKTVTDVSWTGGEFDTRKQKLAKVRPDTGSDDNLNAKEEAAGKVGDANVADALSIRGHDKFGDVVVDGVKVKASNSNWRSAGGDSGVYVENSENITVKNSEFIGVRDAGVYLSDSPGGKNNKSHLIENNWFEGGFDSATAKRGADNVTIRDNFMVGNHVGPSVKPLSKSASTDDPSITGNFITNSERSFDIENATNVSIRGNRIFADAYPRSADKNKKRRAQKDRENKARRDKREFEFINAKNKSNKKVSVSQIENENTVKDRQANSKEVAAAKREFNSTTV
jgi:hypothetical protein